MSAFGGAKPWASVRAPNCTRTHDRTRTTAHGTTHAWVVEGVTHAQVVLLGGVVGEVPSGEGLQLRFCEEQRQDRVSNGSGGSKKNEKSDAKRER